MEQKTYKIKNILESLHDDVESGEITLHEAALHLQEAGWTNFVDEEPTKRLLHLTK